MRGGRETICWGRSFADIKQMMFVPWALTNLKNFYLREIQVKVVFRYSMQTLPFPVIASCNCVKIKVAGHYHRASLKLEP